MKPKQKQNNKIRGYVWLLSSMAVFVFIFLASPDVQASEINPQSVIGLVNKDRLSKGLGVLKENTILDRAAQDKANDMIKNDYFAHNSPKGVSPWYWFDKNNYDYKYAGENLAINFTDANDQHKAWMKSDSHRKNILNPNYKEIGVAVAKGKIDGETSILTVQLFGTQAAAVLGNKKEDAKQEAIEEVKGEQSLESQGQESVGTQQSSPFSLPEELKINSLQPEKTESSGASCQTLACFQNEISSLAEKNKNSSEGMAWIFVVLVLILSVSVNVISLSRHHIHNPFIAANTVVLLMVLTSVVMWRI